MAGTMVHLAVAVELNQVFLQNGRDYIGKWASDFKSDLFFAGNICPDGIMARKGYERSMKLHTHMRDGIPDGTFDEPRHLILFHQRLQRFFQEGIRRYPEKYSLYLGYLTHMLTDEKFILEVHPEFINNIARIGLTRKDRETFVRFGKDVDAVDFRLVKEYPGIRTAYEALCRVAPYEIEGMITEEELTISRNWILQYFFEETHQIQAPKFLSYQRMQCFIREVVTEICEKLKDYII